MFCERNEKQSWQAIYDRQIKCSLNTATRGTNIYHPKYLIMMHINLNKLINQWLISHLICLQKKFINKKIWDIMDLNV